MGKAEAGSTKAIANAIKAKGLGRLRWYCQVCEKQCRDENGFQAHCRSEPHMRKILAVGPKAGSLIADFSRQFQYEYLTLLRTRHSTNRVRANAVYNEYIQDKDHVHMNATRWVTLSGFVQTLGKEGAVRVDEDEKGLWVQWIDNRPETLAKQAAALKKDRAQMDGEERERKMLEEQIARARAAQAEADAAAGQAPAGLAMPAGQKFSLSLGLGAAAAASGSGADENADAGPSTAVGTSATALTAALASAESTPGSVAGAGAGAGPAGNTAPQVSLGGFGLTPAPAPAPVSKPAANPLKRPAPVNVFKAAKVAKADSGDNGRASGGQADAGPGGKRGFMSEAERLMREDQARKGRAPQGYAGAGPRRG